MSSYFQPSEGDIDTLLSIIPDITRQQAIARLKGNNNNADSAVGEYFDDPIGSTTKYSWDEGPFSSDRDGRTSNHSISFNIQGPDDPGNYGFDGGAGTRPPSRSDNKSPLGKIIDLTAAHAAADPSTSHGKIITQEDSDRELAEAIRLSREESNMPPQETGITSTSEVHFGPATRAQYETGQWAMVPLGKSATQEWYTDPEPGDRKREPGVPAFLKPSTENHRLGALLTIYHEIPMIRNIFLNTVDIDNNYGHDKEWWTGKAIEMGKDEYDEPVYMDVDQELQRLMAFLDNTDRSYGSVEALVNHRDVQKAMRYSPDASAAVLNVWRKTFEEDNHTPLVNKIFSAGVASEEAEGHDEKCFAILELGLSMKDALHNTLYDIADEALWPRFRPLELKDSPYLSHIAEVVAFKVEGGVEHKSVEIPAVWYPDRYLKQNREAALQMRIQKYEAAEKLEQILRLEERLTFTSLRTGKIVKTQDLFQASLKHDEAEILEQNGYSDEDVFSSRPSSTAKKLSNELKKVVDSIDRKLLALNEEKAKIHEHLRTLSNLYTSPSPDPAAPKLRKYTLRGVSTTKDTLYICQRNNDLISVDDAPLISDQWWRIQYGTQLEVTKTTEDIVIEAAQNESKSTLLVYASDAAMNMTPYKLPRPLEMFVRFDNGYFRNELENGGNSSEGTMEGDETSQGVNLGPSSPGKRKFDERGSDVGFDEGSGVHGPMDYRISERELHSGDENSSTNTEATITASRSMEDAFEDDEAVVTGEGQEMQERVGNGLGMMQLSGVGVGGVRRVGSEKSQSTIDGMDLDLSDEGFGDGEGEGALAVEKDELEVGESAAVRRVGVRES